MKKVIYFLSLTLILVSFYSCSDDDDDSTSEWREKNEAYFDEIASNPKYEKVEIPQGPGVIYAEKHVLGTDTARALTGCTVKAQYKGYYINDVVFDNSEDRSVEFTVKSGSVIDGFLIALQNMTIGDKWTIYIPWQLGYGSTGLISSGVVKIPGYSTLIFDVEVKDINPKFGSNP